MIFQGHRIDHTNAADNGCYWEPLPGTCFFSRRDTHTT